MVDSNIITVFHVNVNIRNVMTWQVTLDTPITKALADFPHAVNVATLDSADGPYLVSRSSLTDMHRMHLGRLPLSTVALPGSLGDMLSRPVTERVVRDFSHHLTDFLPSFFVAAIYELQSLFAAQHLQAYLIGGIPRDMVLATQRSHTVEDVDVSMEGDAISAADWVHQHSGNIHLVETYPAFGTARLQYKNRVELDFASTRQEVYMGCGLLPDVTEVGVPLEVDISRRDFTVNTLALSIRQPGIVIDCAGGMADLDARQLRFLKPVSCFEDPSRLLRALRFAVRLGFSWGADTRFLADQFLRWLPDVYKGGGDRIRTELERLLVLPESADKTRFVALFVDLGLHRLIDTRLPNPLPLVVPVEKLSQRVTELQTRLAPYWKTAWTWEIHLAILFLGVPETFVTPAMQRLGLTRHEMDVISESRRLLHENIPGACTPNDTATRLYEVFHSLPEAAVYVSLILSPRFNIALDAFMYYKDTLRPIQLAVTGDDILQLGVPQGEAVGRLLHELLEAKLSGAVHQRSDELAWLQARLESS
jgi:tRNA nucleotidyltransferase (CCA-adding enzyme)